MALNPSNLPAPVLEFLHERHLATMSTVRPNGLPHVVPVGFTWDEQTLTARVITQGSSVKAGLAQRGCPVALCQIDGPRWVTLEGEPVFSRDPDRVAEAVRRYAERYRQPRVNPERVVIELPVRRVLLSQAFVT